MIDFMSMREEVRYGCPAADQVLFNRYYVVGYSYYFRQAKWALEIVDPDKRDLNEAERKNHFRSDYRIPKRFRADKSDYAGSGYDRGHLVASANKVDSEIQNSETFLLSNMSPQVDRFNRGIWKKLEAKVRELDKLDSVLETYVICGPIFDFGSRIKLTGRNDDNGVVVPVPSHYFKCVLTESSTGKLEMWAFEMENKDLDGEINDYAVTTSYIEQRSGTLLWDLLTGPEIDKMKNVVNHI